MSTSAGSRSSTGHLSHPSPKRRISADPGDIVPASSDQTVESSTSKMHKISRPTFDQVDEGDGNSFSRPKGSTATESSGSLRHTSQGGSVQGKGLKLELRHLINFFPEQPHSTRHFTRSQRHVSIPSSSPSLWKRVFNCALTAHGLTSVLLRSGIDNYCECRTGSS